MRNTVASGTYWTSATKFVLSGQDDQWFLDLTSQLQSSLCMSININHLSYNPNMTTTCQWYTISVALHSSNSATWELLSLAYKSHLLKRKRVWRHLNTLLVIAKKTLSSISDLVFIK